MHALSHPRCSCTVEGNARDEDTTDVVARRVATAARRVMNNGSANLRHIGHEDETAKVQGGWNRISWFALRSTKSLEVSLQSLNNMQKVVNNRQMGNFLNHVKETSTLTLIESYRRLLAENCARPCVWVRARSSLLRPASCAQRVPTRPRGGSASLSGRVMKQGT